MVDVALHGRKPLASPSAEQDQWKTDSLSFETTKTAATASAPLFDLTSSREDSESDKDSSPFPNLIRRSDSIVCGG